MFLFLVPLLALKILDTNIYFGRVVIFLQVYIFFFDIYGDSKKMAILLHRKFFCFLNKKRLIADEKSADTFKTSFVR